MTNLTNARLAELGIVLPEIVVPQANYVPWVQTGNLIFTAGQIPLKDGVIAYAGQLGADVSVETGYDSAKLCAINVLSVLKTALAGDLDRVARIVKVVGFINAAPGFADHSKVVNGASDLFVAVFGEAGKHARSSVGMSSLPFGAATEVEVVVEIL